MKSLTGLVTFSLATFLAAVPAARAQNAPHIAYVLPAGGQQGTTIQVKVGGQFLPNVADVYISGRGIQGTVAEYARPMNGNMATELRDKLAELMKKPADAEVQKEIIDIRTKLLVFNNERTMSPVLAETVTVQVTIAPDAQPGERELRLATPQGLSNPLVFCIGQLPEFNEKESFNVNVQPGSNQPQIAQPATLMNVTLPAFINGRIKPGLARPQVPPRPGQQFTPGDADRYRFEAHRGQQLVITASARELIPYLADAVPGWFQATLALYDAQGNELAYDDDFRFKPDPVIHFEVPKDGEYTIEIKDALYRGREDFIYRIAVGELPFVTSIFPLGGRAGALTAVKLSGWNLPVDKMTMDAKDKGPGIYPLIVRKGENASNQAPFMVDTLPEGFEKEPNNSQGNAQKVTLPITMNGIIDQPGDWDVFSFEGRAGQTIVAEVYARRLDSPLDSVLRLTDATGRQLAFNDDHEDKGFGLETHHADSYINFTLPANGTYYLYLGDAQQKGGGEYAYRLRISAPRPDFDLRVVPSAINAGAGQTIPVTVYALRKDGFAGDITLALKGAPRGFTLSGALVPSGQDQVRLTLTIPQIQQREPISLGMEGRAAIQGQEIRRMAVPAEDMMQAFAYRHLVPEEDLKVAIRRGGAPRAPIRITSEQTVMISAGEAVRIPVQIQLPPNNPFERILLELSEPPDGITLREMQAVQGMTEIVLQCDAAKAKPGLNGNLIINVFGERQPPAAAGKVAANRLRISLGTLPAIPFEIIKRK
jgi:hypothetical protein